MSLADQLTPSALAVELGLLVNRIRGITGLDIVPMIVVEGDADNSALSPVCRLGSDGVFVAGGRTHVEQLLSHLRREPIDGCECVFLIDCDGQGKTENLREDGSLLVTETCDLEADLVHLGVATRLIARFLPDPAQAAVMIDRACDLAVVISVVRRAAHATSVRMKHPNGRQLRLGDLPGEEIEHWERTTPASSEVLPVIADALDWSPVEIDRVSSQITSIDADFGRTCMGKDALDALHRLLSSEGPGEVRGWSCEHFHKEVFAELGQQDLAGWEVGRRLAAWQVNAGHELLKP
ncbi:MAG: hypothetical protein JJE35_06320 [Thermoleophilia bacterium]|nr:hypothetical protein [Thermoleophilia bacterium]